MRTWNIWYWLRYLEPAKSGRQQRACAGENPCGSANTPIEDCPIEEIIARTWKPKELAPPIATPHFGGPVSYWLEYLKLAQQLLDGLVPVLHGLDPEMVVFPHFLSGPLDAQQRIHFLRFHIQRHRNQVAKLMSAPGFPMS